MKTYIICILLLLFTCLSFSQDYTFLESKNGFRNIKLGAPVADYPEFTVKSESNMELFKLSFNSKTTHVYKGTEKDKIKTAQILFIYLVTENNLITEIRIVTQKVLSVYSTLRNAYGKPTSTWGKTLTWRTDTIECSIEGDDNNIPGYHIRYRRPSETFRQINENIAKAKKEAQAEL